MATVIYLPKDKSLGAAAGEALGGYAASEIDKKRREEKSAKLGELFDAMVSGDSNAIRDSIKSGSIDNTNELLDMVRIMQNTHKSDTIKVDAYGINDGKARPFALSKEDLTTNRGEEQANKYGLTLVNPGKNEDFYADAPSLRFTGNSRHGGNITLPEWKAKYGGSDDKPTDKDKSIQDFLKEKELENNYTNRSRARQYLYNDGEATEVINSAFGKKVGNDWTFDDPQKNEAALIAKAQVESFMLYEGMSAREAGVRAVELAKESIRAKYPEDNPAIVVDENKGLLDKIKDLVSPNDKTKSNINADNSETTDEGKMETIGNHNGVSIEIPEAITSPAEAAKYIAKKYDMSINDAIIFLEDNMPE